jgi:hypothetical protein
MRSQTADLKGLVSKRVKIERKGVTHRGILKGLEYRHVGHSQVAQLRWVLIAETETLFRANDGWTVTPLEPRNPNPRWTAAHDARGSW